MISLPRHHTPDLGQNSSLSLRLKTGETPRPEAVYRSLTWSTQNIYKRYNDIDCNNMIQIKSYKNSV